VLDDLVEQFQNIVLRTPDGIVIGHEGLIVSGRNERSDERQSGQTRHPMVVPLSTGGGSVIAGHYDRGLGTVASLRSARASEPSSYPAVRWRDQIPRTA